MNLLRQRSGHRLQEVLKAVFFAQTVGASLCRLNDDKARGGFARLATLIAKRKRALRRHGPVLVLDAGDYSTGTAFDDRFMQFGMGFGPDHHVDAGHGFGRGIRPRRP